MVNNFWALRSEITRNNGSSRPVQPDSQTPNNHQSTNGYLTPPQTILQRPQNHHLMGVNNQSTNGFTYHVQHDIQTHSNHQSTNGYLTTPQTMPQRPQNHLMGVNNFNQERYQRNNGVDAATLSMRNFPFSANDTTSFITAARYGRVLPLGSGLTSSPQQHMSSSNTTPLSSYRVDLAQNSSSNVVGSHSTNDAMSFITAARYGRALPLGSGVTSSPQQHMISPNTTFLSSYHSNFARNSSSNVVGSNSANDTTSSITAARYGLALPLGSSVTSSPQQHMSSPNTALISSYHENLARNSSSNVVGSQGHENWSRNASRPIFQNQRNFRYLPYGEGSNRRNNSFVFNDFNLCPSGNTNIFHNMNDGSIPSATPPPFYPINSNNLNTFLSSSNANRDSTRDTSTSHRVFHSQDSEARNRSMTSPENGFEASQTEKKELLLFKDDKNTSPTSPVTEGDDANENNDENFDLSLHL